MFDLMIATPAHAGTVCTGYVNSLMATLEALRAEGRSVCTAFANWDPILPRARNRLISIAQEKQAKRLLFVDSDMSWEHTHVQTLMTAMDDWAIPIIAGTYPHKTLPIQLNYNPLRHDTEGFFESSYKRTPEMHRAFANAKGPVVEVIHAPTGFMLIDVERVFNNLPKPYFETRTQDDVILSDDWSFCEKCHEHNIPINLHTEIVLPHHGAMIFDWSKNV